MAIRLRHLAPLLVPALLLAGCEGSFGTKEEERAPAAVVESSSASTESSMASTAAVGSGSGFQGHPLDDPASPLSQRTVYFEFDSASLRDEDRRTIEAHAGYLAENSAASVTLEGHADERGTREYNIGLGDRRATAVRQLMALLGASGNQMRTVSYGEERPAVEGHDETAWQFNRRVEIDLPHALMDRPGIRYRRRGARAAVWLCVSLALAAGAVQAQTAAVEERLNRLERSLNSSGLVQLLQSVDALKLEVRDLRGQLEQQTNTINQLKQRQRELYLDSDARLQKLEGAVAALASSAQAAAPGEPPAPAGLTASGLESAAGPATAPAPAPATQASTASAVSTAGAPAVDTAAEQQAYQAAFDLLKSGRYDEATKAFQGFLASYPGGLLADNAQYWLGETFYVTRRYDAAIAEFKSLVQRFPESQKLTHALLKIGYIHDELGQPEQARRVLAELTERYPQSTAAGLARKRLQRLSGG